MFEATRGAIRWRTQLLWCAVALPLAWVATASAQLVCEGAPQRTTLAATGCDELDGNQAACGGAFTVESDTIASCFYETDGGDCLPCDIDSQREQLCTNECAPPPVCANDRARDLFAGGPGSGQMGGSCRQFDDDPTSCGRAFGRGEAGIHSCFYEGAECLGCGPSNVDQGRCENTCTPPPSCADPSRDVLVDSCNDLDGDSSSCRASFEREINDLDVSCFVSAECEPCQPPNCAEECVPPPPCLDAGRTIYAGDQGAGPTCGQFDGDQASCEQAYAFAFGEVVTCAFGDNDECVPCDPGQDCVNTCVLTPTCADGSRPNFVPLCDTLTEAECPMAYVDDHSGTESCYWTGAECSACGSTEEGNASCTNTCRPPPSCADTSRVDFLGGPGTGQGGGACQQVATEEECETSYHLGRDGYTSCFWTNGECRGCGFPNEDGGLCINACVTPPSCDDGGLAYAGGFAGSCQQFNDDPTACAQAYVDGEAGPTSCYVAINAEDNDARGGGGGAPQSMGCRACSPADLSNGDCTNACQPLPFCGGAPAHTTLADCDDLGTQACGQAYEIAESGRPIPCAVVQNCEECDLGNQVDGLCQNACEAPPPQIPEVPVASMFGVLMLALILLAFGAYGALRTGRP